MTAVLTWQRTQRHNYRHDRLVMQHLAVLRDQLPIRSYRAAWRWLREFERVTAACRQPVSLVAFTQAFDIPQNTLQSQLQRAGVLRPQRTLASLRLRRALDIYLAGIPLSQFYDNLGYSSPQSLARTCRELTGHAPGQWRKLVREAA